MKLIPRYFSAFERPIVVKGMRRMGASGSFDREKALWFMAPTRSSFWRFWYRLQYNTKMCFRSYYWRGSLLGWWVVWERVWGLGVSLDFLSFASVAGRRWGYMRGGWLGWAEWVIYIGRSDVWHCLVPSCVECIWYFIHTGHSFAVSYQQGREHTDVQYHSFIDHAAQQLHNLKPT